MTYNEAIGILAIVVETAKGRCFITDEAISNAYDMAIKALETQEWISVTEKSHPDTPAQPEIIRCKDCRHRMATPDGDAWICAHPNNNCWRIADEHYCGYAERRTDE